MQLLAVFVPECVHFKFAGQGGRGSDILLAIDAIRACGRARGSIPWVLRQPAVIQHWLVWAYTLLIPPP